MDPQANLIEQLELARSIVAKIDEDVPWADLEQYPGGSDSWGDEQDRSEYFEALSDSLGAQANRLAELVIALDEWRLEQRPRREIAQKLVHLLNRGFDPIGALESLGVSPEDVISEDPNLALDDPDNAVIDFGYEGAECVYVQRHGDRWHVHTVTKDGK